MLFYAGSIIEEPAMETPTLVFLTDRNDLDDQLFGQFQRCHEILRQVQSGSELTIDTLVRAVSDERRRPCNSVRRISALNGSDAAILASARGRRP